MMKWKGNSSRGYGPTRVRTVTAEDAFYPVLGLYHIQGAATKTLSCSPRQVDP